LYFVGYSYALTHWKKTLYNRPYSFVFSKDMVGEANDKWNRNGLNCIGYS